MATIGIIGSGNIGSNVARAAIAADHTAVLSNSRGPDSLMELIAELGPGATAATPADAAAAGDLVLVAIPLKEIDSLPTEQLVGKVVMDANNYYPGRDGRIEELDSNSTTTSELLQALLPGSHVVKVFNNINAKDIPVQGTAPGTPDRRALPIAGNDPGAKHAVMEFLGSVGYDAVDMGDLSESWRSERDTPVYGRPTTAEELREMLANTERVQQT